MRAIHVANVPNARVYYILDGDEDGHDGAVVLPNKDPMFINFWSFADRKKTLKPITNTSFHKFFWDGHKGDEADRWNNMFFERLIKPDTEMLSSVPIVTKFPNVKKERNNARGNHASEFKSLTGSGQHEKALGRRRRGGLGRGIGRVARGVSSVFDPKAWDGDGDGIVQEGTPYERPAIPGVNTNLPGMPHTPTKPADFPDDTRDPILEAKPDVSRMRRFRPEGAVGEHQNLTPMPSRRAERMARRTEFSPRREGLRSGTDPHGPQGTGSDGDPRGGTYPPPKPFDVWRLNKDTKILIRVIDERIARARGPKHYEKWQERVRDRVDKELNAGQPIETIADAKRVMGAVNPSFLPGPNGESPRSEASFLGGRELIERFPHGTGVYKLGKVKFRDDDDVFDVHDRNMMYAWLANSIQTGRYDLVNWALVSKTEHDRRADHGVRGYDGTSALGQVAYEAATDDAWRLDERDRATTEELAELMGDEDAPIFAAGTVSQEILQESLGWLEPSGSGYVLNVGGGGQEARDKPNLKVMYSSEPEIVTEFMPDQSLLDPEFRKAQRLSLLQESTDGRTDSSGNPVMVKAYGTEHSMIPKLILTKTDNVAITQLAATMKTLEDDLNRTQEEIDTKGTDGAIAPGHGGRYTKRFMRVYDQARAIFHDSVNQHELGHANHWLAMIEDVGKRSGALVGRKLNFKKLSDYMATKRHAAMTGREKRRVLEFAAIHAMHRGGMAFDADMFSAHRQVGNLVLRHLAVGSQLEGNHPDVIAATQAFNDHMDRYTEALGQPILDHNGAEIRRTPEIAKLLKQAKEAVQAKGGLITFQYDPVDTGPLTRGDLHFLFGPSSLLLNQIQDPFGNVQMQAIYTSPLVFLSEKDNKRGQPFTHEPWGNLGSIMDSELIENRLPNGEGFVPVPGVDVGDKVRVDSVSMQAIERMYESGMFGYDDGRGIKIDKVGPDTIQRLYLARGRVAGLLANPNRDASTATDAEDTLDLDPKKSIELPSQGDLPAEDLLRVFLPSEVKRSLSDREVDDLSKKQVEGAVDRSKGVGANSLTDILKARQLLATGASPQLNTTEANTLLRESGPPHEQVDYPLNVRLPNRRGGFVLLGSGDSVLGPDNPSTGQPWAAGDELHRMVVGDIAKGREVMAQGDLSNAFESHALLTGHYDDLDDGEKDALVEIVAGFGGTRYSPYMGKRYGAPSAQVYAVDATRQEIMSELTALAFAGEEIMIEVEKIDDKGKLVKEFVELSPAQKAIIEKLMKWMKPKAQWGPTDA